MSSDDPEEAARLLAAQSTADVLVADLESRHVTVEKERDEWRGKAESLEGKLRDAFTELSSRDDSLRAVESNLAAAQRDRQVFEDKCATAQAEHQTQQERMDRMEAEADALREEISRLTESNSTMTAKLSEAETKKVLSSSAAIPLQYEVERLRKELDSVSSHGTWLENELSMKSSQLTSCKAEHSKELIELRTNLDKAVADRDIASSREESLVRTRVELQAKVDQLSTQLFEQQQQATESAIAAKDEIAAERRLADLQREQLERKELLYKDLSKQFDHLKEISSKAASESHAEQERIRDDILRESQRALEQQAADHRQQEKELEEQLQEANRLRIEAEDGLMASPPSRRPRALLRASSSDAAGSTQQDEEPLGLTDLYARLSETEDELRQERMEKRRLELYQQKITAEIEAKAPIFLKQRQEYELALEKYQESRDRLDEALEEMAASKAESSELRTELAAMQKRSRAMEQENVDMAKQVQALLRSRAGGGAESMSDSAGDDIAVCVTIEEIQTQNQRLLREHRRLTDTVAELEDQLQSDQLRMQLEDSQKELSSLREDRQRQETLVAGIVQQRDLYRALLAKHDSNIIGGGDGEVPTSDDATTIILSQQKEKNKEIEAKNRHLEDDLAKAKAELSASDLVKEGLEERLARYDAHSLEMTTAVDKLQSQLSAANAAAARSDAEAAYHREKCVRVEETLQASRSETARANDAKKEMQTVNAELQQTLAVANAEADRHGQQFRQASAKLRLAETRVETAKAAESRIALEANSLRSELTRQGALLDSIRRIEASLSAKSEEDKEKLVEDSKRLAQVLERERSKHEVETENNESRVRELELNAKEIERKKDEALSALVEAKKETVAATSEKQLLASKCARLENDLSSAKAKLGEGDAETEEEQTMQARIEVLTSELDSARAELAASKERVTMYKNLSKKSEDDLTDLNKVVEEYKKAHAAEIEQLQKEVESVKNTSDTKQELIVELTRDLSNQRGEQEKAVSELRVKLESLQSEVETSRKDAESATARLAAVDSDIASYRADATTAQNNYERELALHASARTALRSAREEADSEIRLRKIAEEQVENLNAEWNEERKVWKEEKTELEENLKETEKNLGESRSQNTVLHSQLATLGDMLEKKQAEKISTLAEGADQEDSGDGAEMEGLRKMVSEQREVIRFMNSEREVIQAQLDAARRTAERERAAYAVTQRSLDEARSELKLVQEGTGISGEEIADKSRDLESKLKHSEEQLTLLRDSNKLLREEAEKMEKSLTVSQTELTNVKKAAEPSETSLRQLEVQKAALEAEKASLKREIEDWKGRVQSLVTKFHKIDPDEHEKVVKRVEELKKECDELKSEKNTADKESNKAKALLSRVNKDLSQQRALVETQRKKIATLSSEKDDVAKTSKATTQLTKERDLLKNEIQKMKSVAASKETELKGANQRNEVLKTRLRQFQKMILDLKAKEKELTELKAKELEREQAMQRVKSPSPPTQTEEQADQSSEATTTKAPAASTSKPPKKDESKPLPRVPPGGFKFGPGGTSSSDQASKMDTTKEAEAVQSVSEEAQAQVPMETGGSPTPPAASSDVVESAAKPKSSVEAKKPAKTKVSKVAVETKAKPGPQKRKASEGKKQELSIREKLMQKKRRLAELKKAKEESVEGTEDKTEVMEESATKSDGDGGKLSAAAKPFVPSHTDEPTQKEESESTAESPATETVTREEPQRPPADAKRPLTVETTSQKEPEASVEPEPKASPVSDPKASPVSEPKPESDSEPADPANVNEVGKSSGNIVTDTQPAGVFGAASPFGGTGFGTAGTASIAFGSSAGLLTKPSQAPTSFGTKPAGDKPTQASFGSSFLDIKPPGSSSAPFTFGSSATIKLPTPSKVPPTATTTFGIFGQQMSSTSSNPFGGVPSQAKPLFDTAATKPQEASAPEDEAKTEHEEKTEQEGDDSGQIDEDSGEGEAEFSDGEA